MGALPGDLGARGRRGQPPEPDAGAGWVRRSTDKGGDMRNPRRVGKKLDPFAFIIEAQQE